MPRPDTSPDFIEALARGLDVIRAFQPLRPVMPLSEVAAATGLARPTARRILLTLTELGSGDAEILRDLLEQHVAETDSTLAAALLADFEAELENFVRVLPRDYAAVLETRQNAVAEGLDPDGDVVWNRILEVTGG